MIGDYLLRKAVMAHELFMEQLDGVACFDVRYCFFYDVFNQKVDGSKYLTIDLFVKSKWVDMI